MIMDVAGRRVVVVIEVAVSGSQHSVSDDLVGRCLQVVDPSDALEEVDDGRREIPAIAAEFARFVVAGEHVVVIVPSLAQSEPRHRPVLHRKNRSVQK